MTFLAMTKITPLQRMLRDHVVPLDAVKQTTGRGRVTLWRWASGESYPGREDAQALIKLYNAHGHALDFNGCYEATDDDVPEGAS